MLSKLKIFCIIIVVIITASNLIPVSAQAEKEKSFKEKCMMCHEEMLKGWDNAQVKHSAYTESKCEYCHSREHKKFISEKEKPCLICHDINSEKIKKAHYSGNLTDVECASCHYTHGADRKGLLKEFVHNPFISGMCSMCHDVDGEGKITLKSEQKKICVVCHSDFTNVKGKQVHAAFEMSDCTDCHNPHTSEFDKILKKPQTKLCFDCHDKSQAEKHPYDVMPSKKINSREQGKEINCASCHDAHMSKHKALLKAPLEEGKLCKKCHEY